MPLRDHSESAVCMCGATILTSVVVLAHTLPRMPLLSFVYIYRTPTDGRRYALVPVFLSLPALQFLVAFLLHAFGFDHPAYEIYRRGFQLLAHVKSVVMRFVQFLQRDTRWSVTFEVDANGGTYSGIAVHPNVLNASGDETSPQLEFVFVTHLGWDIGDEDRAGLGETGMGFRDEECLPHLRIMEQLASDQPESIDCVVILSKTG